MTVHHFVAIIGNPELADNLYQQYYQLPVITMAGTNNQYFEAIWHASEQLSCP